ncbi:MAG: threonine--tRNA ligase [Pirellulaceae bacterium]
MLTVKLPDGSEKKFEQPTTAGEIAAAIGPGLAKAALAAEVDGRLWHLDHALPYPGTIHLRLLTKKDPESLSVMRHSCAHIMARAVMRLYDGVQLAFGPTTDTGFYYDFELPRSITEEDFPAIEKEMQKIIDRDEPFERVEQPRENALQVCRDLHQGFKVEHIETGLADHETLSFYQQGEFIDLCRGPHIPRPKVIGAFKLLSIAGAYWKGDASNKQLQRLYGTAFFDKKELEEHLQRVEEAKRRDHRVLGKQLELFTISPLVGSGLILWLPKGAKVRELLEGFVKEELAKRQYQAVHTPNIGRVEMYEMSGHFPYYRDAQFPPIFEHSAGQAIDYLLRRLDPRERRADSTPLTAIEESKLIEAARVAGFDGQYDPNATVEARVAALQKWSRQFERYLVKPMNCPHHIMIYQSKPRSYRDLPVRLSEFGTVYRYEKSGELNGMTRVRGFTQDDAHIFCTEEQVAEEFKGCIEMTQLILKSLGLNDYRVRLGFRDPDSTKYVGGVERWNKAEAALQKVCDDLGIKATPELGEAAFYGPKADFVVHDCIGREWQLGTVQLDYNLPERFQLEYIGADNSKHRPVMIHRAPLGSMERFIGVLIEHFGGAFPLWLAPEQIRVLTVSEKSEEYGSVVLSRLLAAGFRAEGDFRAEKLGAKIRDGQLQMIPYMAVVGPRDAEQGTVSLRDRIDGDVGALTIDEAIGRLTGEVQQRLVRKTYSGTAGLGDGGATEDY